MRYCVIKLFIIISVIASPLTPLMSQTPDNFQALLSETSEKLIAVAKDEYGNKSNIKIRLSESESINDVYTRTAFDNGFKIIVSKGFMAKVVQGDINILAFALAHEMSHILRGHLSEKKAEKTDYMEKHTTREEEFEADLTGMQLSLKAGYSYKGVISALKKMITLGQEFSSYEGLSKEHPTWSERLKALDSSQSNLWGAISAFENGKAFLFIEEYTAAERCFKYVTEEFPSCYEAWANLGYAQLMTYINDFTSDDFRDYNIGHIVTGCFYKTSESLRDIPIFSGIDEELWYDAVGSLKEAVRLNPGLTLAHSNLGLAYLLHPAGKDPGKAAKHFADALALAENDTTLDNLSISALYINSGVTDLSDNPVSEVKKFEKAEEFERRFAEDGNSSRVTGITQLAGPILYNKALALMNSKSEGDLKNAVNLFESYLKTENPQSPWWALAAEYYGKLCGELKITQQPAENLKIITNIKFLPVTSFEPEPGKLITLTDPVESLDKKFKNLIKIPVVPKTNLKIIKSPENGLDFLAGFGVLGIFIKSSTIPPLVLKSAGFGKEKHNLSVGMSKEEFLKITGNLKAGHIKLIDSKDKYIYYYDIGIAVRFDKKNKVSELVITQAGAPGE